MMPPVPSPWLVPFDEPFDAAAAPAAAEDRPGKKRLQERLDEVLDGLFKEQRKLMAENRRSLLVVLQGLDACGKDGTIRAITRGLDAAGCSVTPFRAPSPAELDHDFLWRIHAAMPERGRIGFFNRSHYEEVVVVRVHPALLEAQRLPGARPTMALWNQRYESIRDFERHAARNGTAILKFWLNVSKEEQRRRFVDRIEDEDAQWKFSAEDVEKRRRRADYLRAFSDALSATSRPWAPWYAIPADDKPFLRLAVAEIMLGALRAMDLSWPKPGAAELKEMKRLRRQLLDDE